VGQRDVDVVFVIADLSGYTALTEAHGGVEAAKVISRYVELAREALAPDARLVERVGDEVLLVAESAIGAVRSALRIRAAVEREPLFPGVRTGIHGGPVLERDGSYFGPALNLTARVAAHARQGQILCTGHIAAVVGSEDGLECRPLSTVRFRNVPDPVAIYEVGDGAGVVAQVIDPVCQMQVDPTSAPARIPYGGATYYFCSFACAKSFVEHPESYIE
jgi:class 3 adenylate cyclase/YHS domain-containing protein